MKYNVGDRVRIKSLDWYNENKDNYDCVYAGNGFGFWKNMVRHCGEIMKITTVKVDPEDSNKGFYFMENSDEKWTDGMIEGLVEEKCNYVRVDNMPDITQTTTASACSCNGFYGYSDSEGNEISEWNLPEGYQFVDEGGNIINATKIVLEKKKKEYPKTYEECYKIMGVKLSDCYIQGYKSPLLEDLQELLICRDAYWKLYGEEMGLGKPWKPDWNTSEPKYVIACTSNGIEKQWETTYRKGFAFPTPEMRDAFYENFKELIEQCKELL